MSKIEKILVIICTIIVYIIKKMEQLIGIIAQIMSYLLGLVIFIFGWRYIDALPPFWESLIIKGLGFSALLIFSSATALYFINKQKFYKIFDS